MEKRLKRITRKKRQLDKLRPLSPEVEEALDEWMRIEFTYHSIAIEGNSLTRSEVAEIVAQNRGKIVPSKKAPASKNNPKE